jgi:hypothetical protein
MSTPIYPAVVRGLTYTVTKTPKFSTIVRSSPDPLSETRILQAQRGRFRNGFPRLEL